MSQPIRPGPPYVPARAVAPTQAHDSSAQEPAPQVQEPATGPLVQTTGAAPSPLVVDDVLFSPVHSTLETGLSWDHAAPADGGSSQAESKAQAGGIAAGGAPAQVGLPRSLPPFHVPAMPNATDTLTASIAQVQQAVQQGGPDSAEDSPDELAPQQGSPATQRR